jgi:hypothetical protein
MASRVSEGISKGESYRLYAEELRAIACGMRVGECRRKLMTVAGDFDQMAGAADAIDRSKELLKRSRSISPTPN